MFEIGTAKPGATERARAPHHMLDFVDPVDYITAGEYARLLANTNPHPVPKFRTNGPLSNMEIFAKAFGCKKGDPMVRETQCKIW